MSEIAFIVSFKAKSIVGEGLGLLIGPGFEPQRHEKEGLAQIPQISEVKGWIFLIAISIPRF
jgi:hypothetical protein